MQLVRLADSKSFQRRIEVFTVSQRIGAKLASTAVTVNHELTIANLFKGPEGPPDRDC